jgi:hypothetical protein
MLMIKPNASPDNAIGEIALPDCLVEVIRGDERRVYLAGYRADLLIDYDEISSSGGK